MKRTAIMIERKGIYMSELQAIKIKYTWHNQFVIEHKFKSPPYLYT